MNEKQAHIINSEATNQIYVLQIDSPQDITDIRFRRNPEIETTYETEKGKIIEVNGELWATLLKDNNGGYDGDISFDLLFELKTEFGDKFMQYRKLMDSVKSEEI